jgi:DNA modification methylase
MKIHKEVPSSFSDSDLIIGDSAIVLKKLPDSFADLTVTSPPYDNLREYKGYCFDFETIARELYRVTKEGGVVVWVVADATVDGGESGTSFRQALFFMQCGFKLHDTMIWNKGGFSAVGALATRYAPVFEYMFVFSKGKLKTFNPIKDRPNKNAGATPKKCGTVRQVDGSTKPMSNPDYVVPDFGQRFNIWDINPQRQSGANKHPAPFPEQLAADHIASWSNPGDVVLDPFLGSGTTGKMAQYVNRRFIGIEISEEYAVLSKNRVGDEQVMF